jgi:hypothetical protein
MLNLKVWTLSLATWSGITYLVCIVYGLLVPPELHGASVLEVVLPGFEWLTPVGFLIGLFESLIYGAYAGLLFVPLHNAFYRRFAATARSAG